MLGIWDKSLNNKFAVIQPVEENKEVKKQANSFYKNGNANVSSNPFIVSAPKQKITEYSSKSQEGSNIYNKSIGNSKEYINARVNEMLDEYDVIKNTKYGSEFNSSVNSLMNKNDDVLTEFARQNGIARNQVTIPGLIYRFQDQRIKQNPMIGVNANINKFGGNTFENNPLYQQKRHEYQERERLRIQEERDLFKDTYGVEVQDFDDEQMAKYAREHGLEYGINQQSNEDILLITRNGKYLKPADRDYDEAYSLFHLAHYNDYRKKLDEESRVFDAYGTAAADSLSYGLINSNADLINELEMKIPQRARYIQLLSDEYKYKPSDFVKKYNEEHPIASGAGTLTGDLIKYKGAKALVGQGIKGINFLKNASPKVMSLIEEAAASFMNEGANTLGSGGSFGEALASGSKAAAFDSFWDLGLGKLDDAFRIAKKMDSGKKNTYLIRKILNKNAETDIDIDNISQYTNSISDLSWQERKTFEQAVMQKNSALKYDQGFVPEINYVFTANHFCIYSNSNPDLNQAIFIDGNKKLINMLMEEMEYDSGMVYTKTQKINRSFSDERRVQKRYIWNDNDVETTAGLGKTGNISARKSRGEAEGYMESDISNNTRDGEYLKLHEPQDELMDDVDNVIKARKMVEDTARQYGYSEEEIKKLPVTEYDEKGNVIPLSERFEKAFDEKDGVKREISRTGLTEREGQELIKQYGAYFDKSRGYGTLSKGKTKGQGISGVYANDASKGTGGKGSPEERLINAVGGIGRIRFVPRKPEEKQETRPVFRMREEFRIPNWDERIRDEISAENGRPVFQRKYF